MSFDPDVVIAVEGLSKRYEIYDRPRDRLLQMLARGRRQYFREFWALRDVGFEVRRGETLGIVGRNGSGKSTLLQLICGTLNPTAGRIDVRGRVAALLELGAGFNPEFTGRENVFMSAKLLGLSQAEVEARFDAIAAFADIGAFIEQPVKTYSSGMYVRLAFAVIAHVDADILVIDEALAVGDAVFTQRCMRFIRAFQARGTLLFVSHDIAAVQSLCRSAIWLANGQLRAYGLSQDVSQAYLRFTAQETYGDDAVLEDLQSSAAVPATPPPPRSAPAAAIDYDVVVQSTPNVSAATGWKTGDAEIVDIAVMAANGSDVQVFQGGERLVLRIRAFAHKPLASPIIGFLVRDRLGQDLFGENTMAFANVKPPKADAGQSLEATFEFVLPMLPNGTYAVMVSIADGDVYSQIQHHWMNDALILQVSSSKVRYGLVGVQFENAQLNLLQ